MPNLQYPNKMQEAIILANGLFPQREDLIQIMRTTEMLICCDGAINKLQKIGIKPNIIIGDLDSIKSELKQQYQGKIHHNSDQNTNDLTKAVNWAIAKAYKNIIILGATGEREDHTIANIFLLLSYVEKVNIKIQTNYGTFTPITQSTKFNSYQGQQVSIFVPNPHTKITTHNLRYPLKEQNLTALWSGTLNESISDNFKIIFTDKGEAVIYQLY